MPTNPDLVAQDTLMPTRKVMVALVSGFVMTVINKTLPALYPDIVNSPAWGPLFENFRDAAPILVGALAYMFFERRATNGGSPINSPLLVILVAVAALALGGCASNGAGFVKPSDMTREDACYNARGVVAGMIMTNVPTLYPLTYAQAVRDVEYLCTPTPDVE